MESGTGTPASASIVGAKSTKLTSASLALPGASVPGQRTISGSWMPPS
jgi:hypothetical protein